MKLWFKKTILALIAFLLVALLIPIKSVNASSIQPERIVVSFYDETANSRGFNWVTNNSVSESFLQIIKKEGSLTKTSINWDNAETIAATKNDFYPGYRAWKAHVLNLEFNETYYYRVGRNAAWSVVGEQYITDGSEGIYFSHLTDPQSYSAIEYERWTNTIDIITNNFPPLTAMLFAGDLTQQYKVPTDNINEWGYALDGPKQFFMNNIFSPASGNHDKLEDMFYNHFNIKVIDDQSTSMGQYYNYQIGDVEVIVLNTNDELTFTTPLAQRQLDWLEDVLKNSKATWKIVVMHFAVISTGRHMLETDIGMLRNDLMPLFSKYHVDLVLQGHDHVYTRAHPYLWDSTGFEAELGVPEKKEIINNHELRVYDPIGTFYIIQNMATARAAALSPLADPSDFPTFFKIPYSPVTGQLLSLQPKVPTFGFITIKDGKLIYEGYMLEQFKDLVLIDYFAVEKNNSDYVSIKLEKLPNSFDFKDIELIVDVANSYYDLPEEEQLKIEPALINKLENLLTNISLKNYNAAQEVIEMIEQIRYLEIDENLMLEIEQIHESYSNLSNIGKSYVSNYYILENIVRKYNSLIEVDLVINAIQVLLGKEKPNIEEVKEVRRQYDLLNKEGKFAVYNYFDMVRLEAQFNLYYEQMGD